MIELKKITKIYKTKNQKDVCALNNLDFTFPENGFFQLKGYSGSGKTTLLGIIGGLLRPTSGEISFNGADLNKLSEKEIDQYRATNIAYIFQQYCLLDDLDVIENVKLSCPLKDADEKAKECLKLVGLAGYEHRKINELSGGQKQRVSIARALAKDAKIILADEPTASLDKDNSISLFALLKELSSDRLIICASHENEFLEQFNPIVLELNNGELINKQHYASIKTQHQPIKLSKPLLTRRLFSFGNNLFKKYSIRSVVMSILLAIISALSVFSFSLSQFDKDITSHSIMLNTGENSLALNRTIYNSYATFSNNDIEYLQNSGEYLVLPVINSNINPNSYLVSFNVNDSSQVKASDTRYLYSPGFCEYTNEIQSSFPLLCGTNPNAENEILITNFTYDLYKTYGFGTSIRKEEIESMEQFLSLDLSLNIQGINYKIVGIVDCGKEKEGAKEIDFNARFANNFSESNYFYCYAMSSPRNLIFVSPNEKYNNVTTVATNLHTTISISPSESKISVSYLSSNMGNNIKINENNHYGISIFALNKIIPYDLKFSGSKNLTDYSKVFDWENKFSSLPKYSSDISLSKLFSKFNNGATSYLSVLACGEFVSKNGLPIGSELENLKIIATNFYKSIGKDYDFSVLDDDKTEILKSFYVAFLSSTMLDPNTAHSINGFYNTKGKQITFDFLESIKDLLNVELEDLSFDLKTFYNVDNFDTKEIKIGYLNLEEEIMNNYLPSNDSYKLYVDNTEFSTYVNEYGLSSQYKSVILSNLNDTSLIDQAFHSADSINTAKLKTAARNGAIEYSSPMKDYLETTSYFALIFAVIICVISVVIMLLFMLSIGKSEEKNLTLLRTFGYSKYKSIIPLIIIPLISAIIATILSTIFAIIVSIFGNSYLASFFGISALFITTNPFFLLFTIFTPFVLALLSLIIPIIKLKKSDMLSILN